MFLSVFDSYAATAMSTGIGKIAQPTPVLSGDKDGGCNTRQNRPMADALPTSALGILPHLRHAILLEGPLQVAEPVPEFPRRHD